MTLEELKKELKRLLIAENDNLNCDFKIRELEQLPQTHFKKLSFFIGNNPDQPVYEKLTLTDLQQSHPQILDQPCQFWIATIPPNRRCVVAYPAKDSEDFYVLADRPLPSPPYSVAATVCAWSITDCLVTLDKYDKPKGQEGFDPDTLYLIPYVRCAKEDVVLLVISGNEMRVFNSKSSLTDVGYCDANLDRLAKRFKLTYPAASSVTTRIASWLPSPIASVIASGPLPRWVNYATQPALGGVDSDWYMLKLLALFLTGTITHCDLQHQENFNPLVKINMSAEAVNQFKEVMQMMTTPVTPAIQRLLA